MQKISAYLRLMRFDKPIGILLLLWPTLWGLWIAAQGVPNFWILTVFVLGVILMRAAGCIINDIADRHWDGYIHRTQHRPLVTGEISVFNAVLLFIGLLLIALALVLTLNGLTILLAFIASMVAITYPFLKRYTHWPQLGLGIAFAFGIPMAFAAETGHTPWVSWQLFFATVCWTIAYDTMYALADRSDDLKVGIKSTAILFGRFNSLIIGIFQLSALGLLVWVGLHLALSPWFYFGLIAAACFMSYQQYLLHGYVPQRCFRAFLNNQWVGASVFLGIFGHYLLIALNL